jgi:hypothetical protein
MLAGDRNDEVEAQPLYAMKRGSRDPRFVASAGLSARKLSPSHRRQRLLA